LFNCLCEGRDTQCHGRPQRSIMLNLNGAAWDVSFVTTSNREMKGCS